MRPRSAVLLLVPLALLGCKKEDKIETIDIKFTVTASLDPNGGEQVHFEIDTLPNMEVRFYSNTARTDAKGHATIDAHLFVSDADTEASEVDVAISGTLERKPFLGQRTLIIATGKEKVRRPPRLYMSRAGFSCIGTKEPCTGKLGVGGVQFASAPVGTRAEALGKSFTVSKARDETFPLGLLEKAKDARVDDKGDITFTSLPVPLTLTLPDGAKASGTLTLTGEIWKAYLVSTVRDAPGKALPFPGESAAGGKRSLYVVDRATNPTTPVVSYFGSPGSLADVDLLGFVDSTLHGGTCGQYRNVKTGRTTELTYSMADAKVLVWERRTGKKVLDTVVRAPMPVCADTMVGNSGPSSRHSDGEVKDRLRTLVR